MSAFDPAIDALLVKYLLGEATAAEREQVAEWCALDAANRRYFDHFRVLWDASRAQEPAGAVDEEAAWERFRARRAAPEPVLPAFRSMRRRFPLIWLAAAALVLLVGTGIWGYLNRTLTVQSGAIALTQTLPDGSLVTLNKHSSLRYTARFNRSVALDGEGFFSIAPNPAQPFVVKVGAATVQVLGTSFNVREKDSVTLITVETGRVAIRIGDQQQEIGAGEEVRIAGGAAKVERTADQLYQYYRTRVFACHATPLGRLVQVLSDAYNTPIRIDNPGAADLPLTATFQDASLDQVLDVATKTLGLTWSREGQEVVIR